MSKLNKVFGKAVLVGAISCCFAPLAYADFVILDDTAQPESYSQQSEPRQRMQAPAIKKSSGDGSGFFGASTSRDAELTDERRRESGYGNFMGNSREAQDVQPANISPRGAIRISGLKPIAVARQTAIVHKGAQPHKIGGSIELAGSARLEDVLAQIIPSQFSLYAADGVDVDAKISMYPGKNWVAALNTALINTNYMAVINWQSNEVVIAVDEQAKTRRAAAKVAKQVMPNVQWQVLKTDGLLSETVSRWCSEANAKKLIMCNKVSWKSSHDIPIEADAVVTGELSEALKTLFSSVGESSGHLFHYSMYSNGVLAISDNDTGR